MQKEMIENNVILKLTFDFALSIIDYCQKLDSEKKYVISKQLLRSGTSIGANCFEAQNSESKADFIHKMKVAAKEAEETQYWLLLCEFSESYPSVPELLSKQEEIGKVLSKILSTSKRKNPLSYMLSYFMF